MQIKNAIKKAEKLTGQPINKNSNNQYWFHYKGHTISFYPNGRDCDTTEAMCFYSHKKGQHRTEDDMQSDYWPGTFHDNLTQAIKFVSRY